MLLGYLLVILIIALLLGGVGWWHVIPYGYGLGHFGLGGLVLVLIVILILVLMGRL
jgi:hypothetical protein